MAVIDKSHFFIILVIFQRPNMLASSEGTSLVAKGKEESLIAKHLKKCCLSKNDISITNADTMN